MEILKWVFFCLVVILSLWLCSADEVLMDDNMRPGDDVRPDKGRGKSGIPTYYWGGSWGWGWCWGWGGGKGMPPSPHHIPSPAPPPHHTPTPAPPPCGSCGGGQVPPPSYSAPSPVPPPDGKLCTRLCGMCQTCGKNFVIWSQHGGFNMASASKERGDAQAEEPPALPNA